MRAHTERSHPGADVGQPVGHGQTGLREPEPDRQIERERVTVLRIDRRGQEHEVRGLTTAAGIWMSTALGVSAGLGRLELAVPGTALAWIVLSVLRRFEPDHIGITDRHPAEGG